MKKEGSRRTQPTQPLEHDIEIGSFGDELDFFSLISKLERNEQRHHNLLADSKAQELIKKAVQDAQQIVSKSSLSPPGNNSVRLACFEVEEIDIGPVLGAGSYGRVHEVMGFYLNSKRKYPTKVQAAREFVVQHVTRTWTGESRFAIKHLRHSLAREPNEFASALVDLFMEAHFLSALDHPNILKIRGITAGGPKSLIGGKFDEYFIIVDKLSESLKERIETWKRKLKRLNRRRILLTNAKRELKRNKILLEQLQVAFDIANAVEYLHSKGIMHRDIKTSNCGFDGNGICKLFDFGLAAEVTFDKNGKPCPFRESVGSPNYMSPEVRHRKGYDISADVYSYAITVYEILSLSRPFEKQDKDNKKNTKEDHSKDEEDSFVPPSVDTSWPIAIQGMLQRSWSTKSSERPSMSEIVNILDQEMELLQVRQNVNPSKRTTDARRRSSLSSYRASLHEFMSEQEFSSEDETTIKTHATKDTVFTSQCQSLSL